MESISIQCPDCDGKGCMACDGFGEVPAKYYYLKHGEIIEEGDECEVSNSIHDPAKWVPAGRTVGESAPDPSYPSHRKYRRLIPE